MVAVELQEGLPVQDGEPTQQFHLAVVDEQDQSIEVAFLFHDRVTVLFIDDHQPISELEGEEFEERGRQLLLLDELMGNLKDILEALCEIASIRIKYPVITDRTFRDDHALGEYDWATRFRSHLSGDVVGRDVVCLTVNTLVTAGGGCGC